MNCFISHCSQRCYLERGIKLEHKEGVLLSILLLLHKWPQRHPSPSLGFRLHIYRMNDLEIIIIFNDQSLILAIEFGLLAS